MERKTALITDNKSFNADAPNIGVPFNLSGREQKVLMKISNCYNCRSDSRSFYAKENGFSIVKCSDCGLLYLEEHPDNLEISEAHKQGKHTGQRILDVTGVFSDRSISLYLNILDDIFRGNLHEQAKWLDVGCGHGEFIAAIQKYTGGKVSARGTEPNIHKQKSARKRGLHVSYFDLESHEEKYDYISMLNVYSHLPDPPSFLKSLKKPKTRRRVNN